MIDNWIIPIEDKSKQNLLKRVHMPENTLKLVNLYATDVAIIVYLKVSRAKEFKEDVIRIKEALGRLLRVIIDFAEQFELFMPVMGLIETSDEEVERYIQGWEADQDWHMGEFSLLLAQKDRDEERKKLIEELLAGADKAWKEIPKFDPITLDDFRRGLELQKDSADYSDKHRELIKIILESINGDDLNMDKKIDEGIDRWLKNHKHKIKAILEEGDHNEGFQN